MFNHTILHNSYSIQKWDKSFIYSKYLQKCLMLDHMSMPINLQYYSMCSKRPPSACTHALCRARHFVNGCVNEALLQCCAKRVAGTARIYCADMMPYDVTGTEKRQLSSNKSIKQKYLLVYHSKTKLSSNVSIILAYINQVLQGSAATYLKRGGRFYSSFFCSSSQSAKVKELLKSVKVCHSYHKKSARVFFDSRCRPIWLTSSLNSVLL